MSLTFAVVSDSEPTQEALGLFCRRLQTSTGVDIAPCVLSSYSALTETALAGRVDFVWAPPLVAVELEDKKAAIPVVVVKRGLRGGYHAALFARAEAPYRRPEELVGLTAAWVSRESASGYFVPRWHLRSLGVDLHKAFPRELFCSSHEGVVDAVLGGQADVGATHVGLEPVSGQLAAAPWLDMGAQRSSVRVLLLIGPIPGDLIVAGSHVPAGVRRRVAAALLSMHDDSDSAAQSLFQASRFEPVPDGHLGLLRRLARYSETGA